MSLKLRFEQLCFFYQSRQFFKEHQTLHSGARLLATNAAATSGSAGNKIRREHHFAPTAPLTFNPPITPMLVRATVPGHAKKTEFLAGEIMKSLHLSSIAVAARMRRVTRCAGAETISGL